MTHPFQIGGRYRNRIGPYTVLAIHGDTMTIRYDDGEETEVEIAIQARIYENMAFEEGGPQTHHNERASTPTRTITRRRWGSQFSGLADTDFKDDVAGTSWRRKEELGGLLASLLSERTRASFTSYAPYNQPRLHIFRQDVYDETDRLANAKFELYLDDTGLDHGFYIEKGWAPMDHRWDWLRFVRALGDSNHDWRALTQAMQQHTLHWRITHFPKDRSHYTTHTLHVQEGQLHLQSADAPAPVPTDWRTLSQHLRSIPEDHWCNLHVMERLDKEAAITLGADLADYLVERWRLLLPLYDVSTKR